MYWNPRRPPATAGRGRRSLVRALLVFFLSLGLLSGICLFVSPKPQTDSIYQAVSQPVAAVSSAFALPGCVTPGLPQDAATSSVTYTTQRLSSGRLMLIDRLHPLPQEAAAPNTFNILSYSHGMRQKIVIMGVLLSDPNVWILDEPMTGLDPQSSYSLKEMMKEEKKNRKQGNS